MCLADTPWYLAQLISTGSPPEAEPAHSGRGIDIASVPTEIPPAAKRKQRICNGHGRIRRSTRSERLSANLAKLKAVFVNVNFTIIVPTAGWAYEQTAMSGLGMSS